LEKTGGSKAEKDFEKSSERYRTRLEEELNIIKSMGYSGYFLIVADFIILPKIAEFRWGRGGSAAGSLVAYA
jgi:DNA polymerase-3 subunit alpha